MGFRDVLSRKGSQKSSTTASVSSATRPSMDDMDRIQLSSGLSPDQYIDAQPRAPVLAPLRKMFADTRSRRSSSSRRSASSRRSMSSDAAPPRHHSIPFLDLSGGRHQTLPTSRLSTATPFAVASRDVQKGGSHGELATTDPKRFDSSGDKFSTFQESSACVVTPFFRSLAPREAIVPFREVPQSAGVVVSDRWLEFVVPDGWQAVRSEAGFRLVSGPCVGFARATAAEDASAALCDTSQLAVLDTFDVSSSPSVVKSASALLLVVEYRNHGAGRGLALVENNFAGAVVFGLSGPSESAHFLRETEQQLLSTSRVVKAPSRDSDCVQLSSAPGEGSSTDRRLWWPVVRLNWIFLLHC